MPPTIGSPKVHRNCGGNTVQVQTRIAVSTIFRKRQTREVRGTLAGARFRISAIPKLLGTAGFRDPYHTVWTITSCARLIIPCDGSDFPLFAWTGMCGVHFPQGAPGLHAATARGLSDYPLPGSPADAFLSMRCCSTLPTRRVSSLSYTGTTAQAERDPARVSSTALAWPLSSFT